ncbi:hypothetical protein PCK1_001783 [Pneumocystis canis]|nr:hypothetical protein PCK1_001783 [Pneumocystis canis]
MKVFIENILLWAIIIFFSYIFLMHIIIKTIKKITGVHIRRFGCFSIHGIQVCYEKQFDVYFESIKLQFYKPTITKKAWMSIFIKEVYIKINKSSKKSIGSVNNKTYVSTFKKYTQKFIYWFFRILNSYTFFRINNWVDIVITDIKIDIEDYNQFFIGTFTIRFNTYNNHSSEISLKKKIFEIINIVDSVFFISKNGISLELIDRVFINCQGVLDYTIKDIKCVLEFGKVRLPLDEFTFIHNNELNSFLNYQFSLFNFILNKKSFEIKNTLQKSLINLDKEYITKRTNWFDIIHEIQFHIGDLEIRKSIITFNSRKHTFLLLRSKDVGININYIHKNSNAYEQSFEKEIISHQILASCISLLISIYQEIISKETDFILIPMITFTCKTTFDNLTNRSIASEIPCIIDIIANSVITSPSIDLSYETLLSFISIFEFSRTTHSSVFLKSWLLYNYIFKLSFNFSIHEPIVRILVPFKNSLQNIKCEKPTMLISTLSNIFLDLQIIIPLNNISNFSSISASILFISQNLYYQSFYGKKYGIFTMENLTLRFKSDLFPFNNVYIGTFYKNVSINLDNIETIQYLNKLFSSIFSDTACNTSNRENIKMPNMFFLYEFLQLFKKIECHGSELNILIFGNESQINLEHKGVLLKLESWKMNYSFSNINSKDLFFPIYKKKDSISNYGYHLNVSVFNMIPGSETMIFFKSFKILIMHSQNILDTKEPIMELIKFKLTFNIQPNTKDYLLHLVFEVDQICMTYSLLKYYAVLSAMKILEKIFFHKGICRILKSHYNDNNMQTNNFLWEFVFIRVYISSVKIKIESPVKQFLMLDIYKIEILHDKDRSPLLNARNITFYIYSSVIQGFWDRVISIDHFTIYYEWIKIDQENTSKIMLHTNAIRARIPHKFILHTMIESIQNNIKSARRLYHHFFINTYSYILINKPVKAKIIPRIQLKSNVLSFDIEDDPFEARLGLIWRIGLIEQKARIIREATFNIKADKIKSELDLLNSNEQSKIESENDYFFENSCEKLELNQSYDKQGCYIKNYKDFLDFSHTDLSNLSSVTIKQAYEKLQEYNSRSWIKKFQKINNSQSSKLYFIRHKHWTLDNTEYTIPEENILPLPTRPPLLSVLFSKVDFILDKPSFPVENLPQFLQDTGKGLPIETKFSLLIPFNLNWRMTEAKIYIRDYPLPLVYIPNSDSSQSSNLPIWELTSDLVIAEQFPEKEAIQCLEICIIPGNTEKKESHSFNIEIARTMVPIKIYGVIDVLINTTYPTQITWGMSLQPAIQDIMRIFETFSVCQSDPSHKLGFWDKIRLIIHTSFKFRWKGNGNVCLILKGSRDPYLVTGYGAGFIKCWRGNVQWDIGCDSDSRNFMVINSDEFLLAIPDFTRQAQILMNWPNTLISTYDDITNNIYQKNSVHFQKIIMKLKGGVKWTAGLVFEQHCNDMCQKCNGKYQCRIFDFKPHYEIMSRAPKFSFLENGKKYDTFDGFRSHYLHGSLSIICPLDLSSIGLKSNNNFKSYNSIHLTPKVFQHFFNWWSLFNGIMSFPLKTGKLFPFTYTSKKKIGRYLATFKYKLELSPLFLSHIYNYRTDSDWVDKTFTSIGIKGRTEYFTLDIHQKKEEKDVRLKQLDKIRKNTNIIINKAAINSTSTDLRVILSRFNEIDSEDSNEIEFNSQKNHDFKINFQKNNLGNFSTDDDLKWIDIDDFIDLGLDASIKGGPIFQILPLAYIPQFTYFRETNNNHNDLDSQNICLLSKYRFGNEDTHYCLLNKKKDPSDIQVELIQKRQNEIIEQIDKNKNKLNYIENVITKKFKATVLKPQYEKIMNENTLLFNKYNFINTILLHINAEQNNKLRVDKVNAAIDNSFISNHIHEGFQAMSRDTNFEHFTDFNNRFFVYNIQLKWYNSVRNILLAYIHQVTQRKGFVYYMSQRAVKFITNLIKEQIITDYNLSIIANEKNIDSQRFNDQETNDLIHELINNIDNNNFTIKDERTNKKSSSSLDNNSALRDDFEYILSKNYECQHDYVFKLFAPQVQLQSEKNSQAVAIITAQNMHLKVFSIMDKSMTDDLVNGLIQQKFIVKMDNAQIFVSEKNDFIENSANFFHTHNYGSIESNWPPWIPLESIYDFANTPVRFTRVVDQTSASFKFIKNNRLRLKKNDKLNYNEMNLYGDLKIESSEQYVNSIFVDFPKIVFTANSSQYYIIFLITTDLLIYIEPAQKERSERLERLMLAADFSDLTGTAEMVINLQEKIRSLEEARTQHRLCYENCNMEHKLIKVKLEAELRDSEDELFYLMKSIATSQKYEGKINKNVANMSWILSASEIIWHSLLENNKPFIDLGLSNATYQRTDNFDCSNFNILEIETIQGINLLPKTNFPDLLSPYFAGSKNVLHGRRKKMIRIYWHMLGSIGGIPIMDHFEVNLFPLSIKLEHDVGKKIFEYVFPGRGTVIFNTTHEKISPSKKDTNIGRSNDESYSKSDTCHPFYSSRNSSVSLLMSSIKFPIESFSCLPKLSRESVKSNSSFQMFYDSEDSNRAETLKLLKSDTQITDSNNFEKVDKGNNRIQPKANNDLNQMVLRANNNMTLVYVKVPSVILCLSYKGPKKKNIEDLNNFVFCIPTIEYRNKTWSYFDLALHLKKEVIKAIIGHTGSLVKDKFMQHYSHQKNSRIRHQHMSFKINMPLNYKNKRIGFQQILANIKDSDLEKRNCLHFSCHNSPHFLESLSCVAYLPKYEDNIEDSEECRIKKAKMLLGKFITTSI